MPKEENVQGQSKDIEHGKEYTNITTVEPWQQRKGENKMNLGFLCSWEFSVVTNLFNGIPCHPVAGRQFPASALKNAAYNLSKAFTF